MSVKIWNATISMYRKVPLINYISIKTCPCKLVLGAEQQENPITDTLSWSSWAYSLGLFHHSLCPCATGPKLPWEAQLLQDSQTWHSEGVSHHTPDVSTSVPNACNTEICSPRRRYDPRDSEFILSLRFLPWNWCLAPPTQPQLDHTP